MAIKKTSWFTRFMAGLAGVCVAAAAFFGITYGIPSIREQVWTPDTNTTGPVEDTDNNTDLDNTQTKE